MPDLEIFLKLDGIDGESTAKGHRNEIDVLSYEQAIDVSVYHSGTGGGASAGKATYSPVRFRKNVDAASIPMLLACASGKHVKSAKFTFRRNSGAFEFYTVTLEHVLITRIAQRAGTGEQYPLSFDALNSGASNDGFIDEVTLDYATIRWQYRVRKPSGTAGTTISGGWDVVGNKKL